MTFKNLQNGRAILAPNMRPDLALGRRLTAMVGASSMIGTGTAIAVYAFSDTYDVEEANTLQIVSVSRAAWGSLPVIDVDTYAKNGGGGFWQKPHLRYASEEAYELLRALLEHGPSRLVASISNTIAYFDKLVTTSKKRHVRRIEDGTISEMEANDPAFGYMETTMTDEILRGVDKSVDDERAGRPGGRVSDELDPPKGLAEEVAEALSEVRSRPEAVSLRGSKVYVGEELIAKIEEANRAGPPYDGFKGMVARGEGGWIDTKGPVELFPSMTDKGLAPHAVILDEVEEPRLSTEEVRDIFVAGGLGAPPEAQPIFTLGAASPDADFRKQGVASLLPDAGMVDAIAQAAERQAAIQRPDAATFEMQLDSVMEELGAGFTITSEVQRRYAERFGPMIWPEYLHVPEPVEEIEDEMAQIIHDIGMGDDDDAVPMHSADLSDGDIRRMEEARRAGEQEHVIKRVVGERDDALQVLEAQKAIGAELNRLLEAERAKVERLKEELQAGGSFVEGVFRAARGSHLGIQLLTGFLVGKLGSETARELTVELGQFLGEAEG